MIKTVFLASGKTRLKEVKQTKTRAVETGKKGRGHDNTSKKWCFSDKKTVFSIDKSFLVYYNKNSKGYTGRRKRPRNKSSCAGNCMKKYEYVNVRLGTLNTRRFSNGNVLPIISVPHGMASFTIQNENSRGSWFYSPCSRSFEGIRLTHQPSPWVGDYGNLILTGQRGALYFDEERRWSSFDAEKAVLEPAYMKAYVCRDRYTFELTPTNSGAAVRFCFSEEGVNRINLIGMAKTVFEADADNRRVTGYTTAASHPVPCGELREYFVLQSDVPFRVERGENAISLVTDAKEAEIRFSTSFLSAEQALLNYERELKDKSFEEICDAARAEWEEYLSSVEVEGADEERKAVFYTCMYRAYLWPRRFYERDAQGRVLHLNMETGKPSEGYMYADNGFWDTYRTLYPYLSLVDTKLYAEIAEGIYNYYADSGWLPKWLCPNNINCMPGMLVEAVAADAAVKEIISRPLAEKMLTALLHDGECDSGEPGVGRTGLKEYRKYGYVPYTAANESVNETLDGCYGDYCIAQVAAKLGKKEIAERYYGYAKNYRNLFDPSVGFMRGKDEKGNFREEDFDPYAWGRDYTEGSAWQSSFAVYHDIAGLNELYGGKLAAKIDEAVAAPAYYSIGGYAGEIHEMSEMAAADFGQCAISNQPSFHMPYIYSELGDVGKTAALCERLAGAFRNAPDGFPGDEDNGTMAAWFILTCLGMYQMCPSRPDFTMSLPLFDRITVRLANGRTLRIEKSALRPEEMRNIVGYDEVMQGGNLADIVRKK